MHSTSDRNATNNDSPTRESFADDKVIKSESKLRQISLNVNARGAAANVEFETADMHRKISSQT